MYKFINSNIIPPFLLHNGSAESFHFILPTAINKPFPQQLHETLLLSGLDQLDVDELLKRGFPFRGIFGHIWCGGRFTDAFGFIKVS
uniref:Uncharacterized protein n=1 Tax=Glycine max TaxID=3847 RepID=C6SZL3_SOYBN|nr:unknown [Glycine max]